MYGKTLSSLFLVSDMNFGLAIGLIIGCFIVALGIGIFVGIFVNKKLTESKLGKVQAREQKIIDDAKNECKALKKEAILEAKEQELQLRNEFERESKEKKIELQKQEQRILQKEDSLDKKEEALSKKNDALEQQKKELANKELEIKKTQDKINHQHELMISELEKVAQLTKEEAKQILSNEILDETRHDVALQVRNIEQTAKDEATQEAKKIISLAIQRCAADHASEITVSVVQLPSDDMKARLIGREGRNIRAIENATGIELIIDDTPEVVILSGFDPVRREIARLSLEKLITDGRIHPARIEETVEKVKKEMDAEIKAAGESAMFEVGIFGLHPEIIKLLGRLKYRTSYGQNVYKHSIEVAQLAGDRKSTRLNSSHE